MQLCGPIAKGSQRVKPASSFFADAIERASSHRAGRHSPASGPQNSVLKCVAQIALPTMAPLGSVRPFTVTLCGRQRPIAAGTGGKHRSDSCTTALSTGMRRSVSADGSAGSGFCSEARMPAASSSCAWVQER